MFMRLFKPSAALFCFVFLLSFASSCASAQEAQLDDLKGQYQQNSISNQYREAPKLTLGSTLPNSTDASKVVAGDGNTTSDLATSQDPVGVPDQQQANTSKNSQRFAEVLKANIKETFELDPRLEKELTQGDELLRPIKFIENNFSAGYNPSITWTRQSGAWTTDYTTRALSLYLVGPVTKHLSGWFQMTPLVLRPRSFFQDFELFQGLANYGTEKTLVQFRGGQCFNWQNQGWGGADRTITQTSPGVYTAFNGFDPTAPAKTVSLDVTGANWTSGRVFGYWQPAGGIL